MKRSFADLTTLHPIARASKGRGLTAFERLTGGSKKGVYRLTFTDGDTALLYVWSAQEKYWPVNDAQDDDFADESGLELFRAAHDQLEACGVPTPRLVGARRHP